MGEILQVAIPFGAVAMLATAIVRRGWKRFTSSAIFEDLEASFFWAAMFGLIAGAVFHPQTVESLSSVLWYGLFQPALLAAFGTFAFSDGKGIRTWAGMVFGAVALVLGLLVGWNAGAF
ncbi:hypothetical protein [Salininema proteolyticum]|uniref:Uncharacterized protein n=1 Tax=Salininema proteolyticum TaxID=1607685 RepID=A0ABV8TZD9_9ACTN